MKIAAVLDTAPLLAFLGTGSRSLGRNASRAIEKARIGAARLVVPTVCLYEVTQLQERGRIALGMPFDRWCDAVERSPGLVVVALERAHVSEAQGLPTLRDPFDRLIVGTALALGLPLVTADARVTESRRVRTLW